MKAKKRVKPCDCVLFAVTVILAFLFIYPVLFALMSAFKSNGDILKSPISFPTGLYIQNFRDLFAQSDFLTAILHCKVPRGCCCPRHIPGNNHSGTACGIVPQSRPASMCQSPGPSQCHHGSGGNLRMYNP